ncbi:hypothetical protein RvY_04136 [Ramazzottius varieornatus]|uniref:Uncharacterized protein n=1 Tax=Ramazzottius varieornatus TaxID=947166 RepID=A0A1D1UZV1_RAMVA|nr:hypothetical protein RvY_04136 [Ramazzottius varieornatus]
MCCVVGTVKDSTIRDDDLAAATLTQLLTAGPVLVALALSALVTERADLTCVGVEHTTKEGLVGSSPIRFSRLSAVAVPAIIIINFVSIIIKLPAS